MFKNTCRFAFLLLLLPAGALADAIYTYTGNPFTRSNEPGMTNLTVTLDLAYPLAPNLTDTQFGLLSWSTSDGYWEISSSMVAQIGGDWGFEDLVTTDGSGRIVGWDIYFGWILPPGEFDEDYWRETMDLGGEVFDTSGWTYLMSDGEASNVNSPGVWTMSGVPEPGTFGLIMLGAVALLAARRKRSV